jgi:hypothetical protein
MDKKAALLTELQFMKDLFENYLPVGANKKDIQKYFSSLEEIICTKEDGPNAIQREEFPPDDPAISGTREYRYYSADQFKKLAGGYQQFPDRQDMGHTESKQAELPSTEDRGADPQVVAHIQERSPGRQPHLSGFNQCPDIQGQLDGGDTR